MVANSYYHFALIRLALCGAASAPPKGAEETTTMATVAAPFSIIGQPIPRVEGADKITGRARYSADIHPPNTLWARNVRSPHPHARIVAIDTSRALRVPGVRAVLTASDFPN